MQQYLVKRIASKISAFLGTPVSLSGAEIDLLNNITLHDFCVQTPQHDTILYTPELETRLNAFALSAKFMEFRKVTMNRPKINFYIDSTNTINFQFIINKLQGKNDTSSKNPMVVSIREINLVNAEFFLKSFNYVPKAFGMNFTDLYLNPMNVNVTNLRIDQGVTMNIRHFSVRDQSGFIIDDLSSRLKISRNIMVFNHVKLLTPESNIQAHQVQFSFNSYKEFKTGVFGKKVKLNIELFPSDISTNDIAYFLTSLKGYQLKANVSGTFRGVLNDLKGRDLNILYGKKTQIRADVDINGLPDITSSFLHVNFRQLYTIPADIETIRIPTLGNKKILLPENIKNIRYFSYKGKFSGFLQDFVAYGTITTNLGKIESDLSLKPDTAGLFSFKGQLKTYQFDIGTFLEKYDMLGKISMNAMVNGVAGVSGKARAQMNGIINSFVVNNYDYKNVKINGTLSNHTYDGSVSISDPNISFDFLGKVNLSNHIPVFNFKANVKHARLYPLHLDLKDTGSFVSFYATADFEGNNIDNLNGEIKLWNSTFRKTGKQIQVNDFLLFTKNINDTNRLILRSDLADAEIWGNYRFSQLKNSFVTLARNYLPSLVAGISSAPSSDQNDFRYEVEFKDTREITDFFAQGLYISKDSKLSGTYNPARNIFDFQIKVPLLQHKVKKWYNLMLSGKTSRNHFTLISGCDDLKVNNKMDFKNLSMESDIRNDSVDLKVRWNNWDTISYKGNLSLAAKLVPSSGKGIPTINVEIKPSLFVIQDTMWLIKPGRAGISQTGITVDQFVVAHNNQVLKVYGGILQNAEHSLSAELKNFNLENLNAFISSRIVTLGGVANGNFDISNIGTNPVFHAALTLDSLDINHQRVGKTIVNAAYDSQEKEVKIEGSSNRGSIKTLSIQGSYKTVPKNFNFDIGLNKLKMDVFEPYISKIFSNVRGVATGSLNLSGTPGSPELNGLVKVQKGAFRVIYLNTNYSFTDNVEIKKNKFLLKNIEINDSKGNKAIVNGNIEYRNLKDIYTDLRINASHFEALNTTEKDNNLFYGQGFATGTVNIRTMPQNVTMDIDASTDQGTIVSIPLSTRIYQTESNFIRFVNRKEPEKPFERYEIDKEKNTGDINYPNNFKLNFDLHVTPNAAVQIVFDQKIGDMITGTGSGDLNLKVEDGTFNMSGKYIIDKGNYLFTLQNVINKNFDLDRGGSISWDGNPADATVDIKAIYKVKTSLFQLTADESYKKPIDVNCRLFLSDKLMTPTIRYDIDLPSADQQTKNVLYSNINTEEEKSKQFLALLIGNSFMPSENVIGSAAGSSSGNGLGINAARSTGLEFLSNQFSRMLSQISKDFDIGFNYRPGDEGVTNGQAEMAFSTQFLNDRLSVNVNGNLDMGRGEQVAANAAKTTNNIVGEGSIEYKITENGKLRTKVFNRSNQNNLNKAFQTAPYTQGIGIFYQEEFNSFFDLMKHYVQKMTGKKEEPPQPEDDVSSVDE